jgi:hypothetical protein
LISQLESLDIWSHIALHERRYRFAMAPVETDSVSNKLREKAAQFLEKIEVMHEDTDVHIDMSWSHLRSIRGQIEGKNVYLQLIGSFSQPRAKELPRLAAGSIYTLVGQFLGTSARMI